MPILRPNASSGTLLLLLLAPLLYISCNILLNCPAAGANTNLSFKHGTVPTTEQTLIASACQKGLDFVSVEEFKGFMEQFKLKSMEQLHGENVPSACLKFRDALLQLESLIQTQDVCDPGKIDALVDYHERHLARSGIFASSRPKAIMQKFFSKYAIQVAYVCKNNLIKNLELSREELRARSRVFEEAREKIFKEEPSIRANIKLIEEQPDEPMSTNLKPKDGAEMTLNEYREALTKLKRPEDILTFDRRQCERSSARRIKISKDKVQTFFKPALMCLQLARYYAGNILSIAKLANIGYTATDDELDSRLADNPMIKNWIVAAQVCEPMLYMRSEKTERDWVTIDTCSQRVVSIETMGFDDRLEEIDSNLLNEMLQRSEATRDTAQKIMRSAIKKMAKMNLMKELKFGKIKKRGIFSKSLSMLASATTPAGLTSAQITGMASDSGVSRHLLNGVIDISSLEELSTGRTPDEKSFEELMKILADGSNASGLKRDANNDHLDGAVSMFDPLTTLFSTLTILAVMLSFEWLFFIVMTLAARLCHQLYFNFDNILTFPPKVLSWSDADFSHFSDGLDKIDEDDFFDYDELNPDEQRQRDLLAKVFGKPPPMLFRG